MLQLTNQQLQAAVAQLDQAIYSHEQWHKYVLRVLVCRVPPDAADLAPDAYRHCRFGQWYEGDDARELTGHSAFVALGEAHRQMHERAARLMQRVADRLDVEVNEYDQFDNTLDRLRLEIQSLRGELVEMAQNRDPLTGARNRAGLLGDLREQQALVRREVQECALVMADVDHFKAVNDRHGHQAGDAVLRAVAQLMQAEIRPYDHLYRYGGEEFLVVMPQRDVEAAVGTAERFRAALGGEQVSVGAGGEPLSITASFGVAALDGDRPVEESIDRADKALYRAKEAGRNRVESSL